jgi:hypothetical protein
VLLERGIQHVERFDLRFPAPRAELLLHELRVRLVVRGADVRRLGGHLLHPRLQVGCLQLRVELLFERALLGCRAPRRAGDQQGDASSVRIFGNARFMEETSASADRKDLA